MFFASTVLCVSRYTRFGHQDTRGTVLHFRVIANYMVFVILVPRNRTIVPKGAAPPKLAVRYFKRFMFHPSL